MLRWVVASIISIVLLICIISIVLPLTTEPKQFAGNYSLPLDTLTRQWPSNKNWNIVSDSVGNKYMQVIGSNTLKVTYPQGSYIPSSPNRGGFQFYARPKTFPSQQITFTYRVMFPTGFDWVKGGKLPGLWIGNMGASGGKHMKDGSSFRVMWREGGAAEAYVYLPRQPNITMYQQPGYINNGPYGESLWRGQFAFRTDVWNNITLLLKVNTPGKADGIIALTINNITQRTDGVLWIDDKKQYKVSGLMMHTFFGGSDASWATPMEQNIYFRNFRVSNV